MYGFQHLLNTGPAEDMSTSSDDWSLEVIQAHTAVIRYPRPDHIPELKIQLPFQVHLQTTVSSVLCLLDVICDLILVKEAL